MDDKQLATGIHNRDERMLECLIDQYGGLIKSIVSHHLPEYYREECINDILFSIWNHIGQYDPDKNSLKNWIGAISKYKCIDYKRKYYRENFVELDDTIPAADQTEQCILQQEIQAETEQLLKALPERDRELFRRRYIEEESMDEISAGMGIERTVLYNRLSRGKKKLRNFLRRGHREEPV